MLLHQLPVPHHAQHAPEPHQPSSYTLHILSISYDSALSKNGSEDCQSSCAHCGSMLLQKLIKHKLLDSDGLCAVGDSIENGEIFINKVSPTNTKDMLPMGAGNTLPDNLYKPTPMSYKGPKGETSVVDKVLLTQNDEQEDIFKVT